MTDRREFVVAENNRLDRAVVAAMPELSRSQVRRFIEEGLVEVAGTVATRPAHSVRIGATVTVVEPVVPNLDWQAQDVPLDVIFEDEETLVLNKPAGIIVHPTPGSNDVTLINAVRARYPEVRDIDDTGRGGIVHRLDRDTTGVIAIARSQAAQFALKEQWKERETLKRYITIVVGYVDPSEGMIETQVGPDPQDPRRQAVVEQGRTARTEFHVLEQLGEEAALVDVRIYTGRTHQIRVHMAAIGNPVLGDWLYGKPSDLIDRQALHARLLGFSLPSSGAWREFEAPTPPDFQTALDTLRLRHAPESTISLQAEETDDD
jgi:23S rRNA pseudouridine1911/1915/1917 synthase